QPAECRDWLEHGLRDGAAVPAPLRAKAMAGAGILSGVRGGYPAATPPPREGLGPFPGEAGSNGGRTGLVRLGLVAFVQRDDQAAAACFDEALPLFRDLGEEQQTAACLLDLGELAYRAGDYARATALTEEALGLVRDRDREGLMTAFGLSTLG